MQLSRHAEALLAKWEGDILHVYHDAAGLATILIGHLLTKSELQQGFVIIKGEKVDYNQPMTEENSFDLLAQDCSPVQDLINKHCTGLNQNQFDAFVIFAFNIGDGGFLGSSALKLAQDGKYEDVPDAMRKWNKITVNGEHKVCDGLISRREKEILLWTGKI